MTKLLRANFTRMFKDKVFWVCIIAAFCTGLVTSIVAAASEPSWLIKWGPKIIQRFKEVPFFASVFASLFLGTEYSNGTLRNKLMIGSARADIYFSSLITVAAGGLLIMANGGGASRTRGLRDIYVCFVGCPPRTFLGKRGNVREYDNFILLPAYAFWNDMRQKSRYGYGVDRRYDNMLYHCPCARRKTE